MLMRYLAVIISFIVSVSCAYEKHPEADEKVNAENRILSSFATQIAGAESISVKSILPDDIETKVSDVTLASYDESGTLTDVRYYESDFSMMSLYVSGQGACNVYALVNMGDMTRHFPGDESEVPLMEYMLQSFSSVETSGFPMSGILRKYRPSQGQGIIKVDRLFSKLCVRILHKSLSGYTPSAFYAYNLCNRSLFVRQANRRMMPFAPEGSRAVSTADILTSSDYNPDLNDRYAYDGPLSIGQLGPGPGYFQDTTVVLYVPENAQGNLLPSNTDPFGKVYDKISDIDGKSYSGLCTYLEFNARREATQGYSGNVMYRYYLGADNTSDFNLLRNKRYDLTLDFTEGGFFVNSWKVSRGDDWTDGRVLEFVDEPYLIQPGGIEKIMIHYSRSGGTGTDSQSSPGDWELYVDEQAMKAAGLSYSFNPDVMEQGRNGCYDFCINVKASASAKAGSVVPVRIMSKDGALSDASSISVIDKAEFAPVWSNLVGYVSQEGILTMTGVDESDLPLSVTLSDGSKISCTRIDDESFTVVAQRTGDVTISVRNVSGSKTADVKLSIKAPVLDLEKSSLSLNPDGETVMSGYAYLDDYGNVLSNVNAAAFDSFLRPVVDAAAYFRSKVNSSAIEFEICSLYVSGVQIGLGRQYPATASASDCPDVASKDILLMVENPFPQVQARQLGKIDDYTLFAGADVDPLLRASFADEMKANETFEFQAFVPDASAQYVSAALEPEWEGTASGPNGVYEASLNAADGVVEVIQSYNSSSLQHSAGKHRLMINVTNRHSSEKIGVSAGTVDVYVHTAIGAHAVFGSQQCGYNPFGNETFASVYNTVAGSMVYASPSSTARIHYIDVSVEWMTDVSRVYVLGQMTSSLLSGGNRFDGADMIRPSVYDGQTLANTRMLYSVCRTPDSRISVCGEKYRPLRGIGTDLYRALLLPTYSRNVTESELRLWFFGCQPLSDKGSVAYAPCYELYDKHTGRIVTSRSPYYFTPSALASYTDDYGRGHHVIHFLETIAPDTYGWINLL